MCICAYENSNEVNLLKICENDGVFHVYTHISFFLFDSFIRRNFDYEMYLMFIFPNF